MRYIASQQQALPQRIYQAQLEQSQDTSQRQELLLDKAVTEYNKLLARYNDLLQRQQSERQLI